MPTAEPAERRREPKRSLSPVESLDPLIAAHPAALRDFYAAGSVLDPTALEGRIGGRFLAVEPLAEVHALARPVVRAVLTRLNPWQGTVFQSGGTAGHNVVLGRDVLRFRCEAGPSLLDGEETLVLRYDGLDNPWPFDLLVDELRVIGQGVALGPSSLLLRGEPRLLLWWGLQWRVNAEM